MDTGGFEIRTPAADDYSTQDRPITLAMQRLWVTGQILPVGARILVQHTFRNGEDKPLEVVYAFMLPRDAALRRFEVKGDGFTAHSELRKVEEAVKQYEDGIDAGHLSTLVRSYRDGVVNLSIGNLKKGDDVTVTLEILAGVELRDDGLRFRFPFTLAPGYHAQARMVDTKNGGEIELPPAEFGDVILPTYKRANDGLHEVGFDLALRIPGGIAEVASPSHTIRYREEKDGRRVSLSTEADVPNRDLVLDVRLAEPEPTPGPSLKGRETEGGAQFPAMVLAGERSFALAIASTRFGTLSASPRKVALVIDRSGSMQGQPMEQARKAVRACLAALGPEDEFAVIAFDDSVEQFSRVLVKADDDARRVAGNYMVGIDARGGTELAAGFEAGARMVAGGGDVLVITDGQVMGTEEIIGKARLLGVRIHCLGIGSASQDRFLAQLATSTGGVSRMVTPQERVDVAAVDLFASIGRPVASGIAVTGALPGSEMPDAVFAGTPWVAFGSVDEGRRIGISWNGGHLDIDLPEVDVEVAETVRLLDGARMITDAESRLTSPPSQTTAGVAVREQSRLERRLEQLSIEFGLASRMMALVAVVERAGDRAGSLPSTQVVPLGMPQDTQYEAYFGGAAIAAGPVLPPAVGAYMAPPSPAQSAPSPMPYTRSRAAAPAQAKRGPIERLKHMLAPKSAVPAGQPSFDSAEYEVAAEPLSSMSADETDRLLEIASTLGSDGGVPGGNGDDRALKTASAVIFFLSEGHTPTSGAFRAHVDRMVKFLQTVSGLAPSRKAVVDRVVAFARAGKVPKNAEASTWEAVEEAIG